MIKKFLACGIIGWCLEISFTALHSFRRRDLKLSGQTSLWMFPIYGSACLISPASKLLKNRSTPFRGCFYALCIFIVEFVTGTLLSKKNSCPWNYQMSRLNIKHVIRLDYAPFWFLVGLLYEKMLCLPFFKSSHSHKISNP